MTKRIWLNFPKSHSLHAAALRVFVVRSGGKFSWQAQKPFHLLKSQDSSTERKIWMNWQIYLHLNLMKTHKSSLFMQNTPSSVRCFSSHSLIPGSFLGSIPHCLKCRTPESSPYLVPYGLWSTNLNYSMPLFLFTYLYLFSSELSPEFFENRILARWTPLLSRLVPWVAEGTLNSPRQAADTL